MDSLLLNILSKIVQKVDPKLYNTLNKTFYTLADSYHVSKYYYNQYGEHALVNYLYINGWQDPRVVEYLIDLGAAIDDYDNVDLKPLFMYAANAEILQIFLQKGINPDKYRDREAFNALFFVKDSQMAQLLIDAGINVNAVNDTGTTALFYARSSQIARTLIKNGADVNHKNKWNNTPLHSAKNVDIAKALIDSRADVNALDNFNNPPLAYAVNVVKEVLLAAGADPNLVPSRV